MSPTRDIHQHRCRFDFVGAGLLAIAVDDSMNPLTDTQPSPASRLLQQCQSIERGN
jgi:hypothetical protein